MKNATIMNAIASPLFLRARRLRARLLSRTAIKLRLTHSSDVIVAEAREAAAPESNTPIQTVDKTDPHRTHYQKRAVGAAAVLDRVLALIQQ